MKLGESITKLTSQIGFWFKKNSPELLMAGGIVAAAGSVVLASLASRKIDKVIDPAKEKIEKIHEKREREGYPQSDVNKDLTKVYLSTAWELVKLYGPTALSFTMSIAAILSSHKISKGRNLALAAAYTSLNDSYKAYRQRVAEKFGEDKENDIFNNMKEVKVKETVTDENGKEKTVTKKIKVPDLDEHSPCTYLFDASNINWDNRGAMNLEWLLSTEHMLNQKLKVQGYLFLSDVYDALDINNSSVRTQRQLQASHVLGWLYDVHDITRDSYVSFGLTDQFGHLTDYAMDMKRYDEQDIWLSFNVDGDILTGDNGQKTFMSCVKN